MNLRALRKLIDDNAFYDFNFSKNTSYLYGKNDHSVLGGLAVVKRSVSLLSYVKLEQL